MACVEKLWDIGFRTLSSASLAARSETLAKESLSVGDLSTTAWWSTIFETVTILRGRCWPLGMAVDPPERDERERRPREERAIGSARCNLLQYLFMYFSLYMIYTLYIPRHLYIGTSSAWYTYISGTGGSSRFPSGLVSSSTGTVSSVQARWFCHLTRQVKE